KLFKPSGKIPKINQQLDSLDDLFKDVVTYKNNEATYQNKQEQLDKTHLEMKHLQKELQEIKETRQNIERLRHYLPMIHDYHMYMEQLEKYPSVIQLPEDGLERFNLLKEKILPLQSQLSILKTNQSKYEAEKATLQESFDNNVLEKAQAILEKNDRYREYIREQESIQEKSNTMN